MGQHCSAPDPELDLSAAKIAEAIKLCESSELLHHIDELRNQVKGTITLLSDYDAYQAARRRVYNQDASGWPLFIVRVSSAEDIRACVLVS